MRKLLIPHILFALCTITHAQNDANAKKLLDLVSAKYNNGTSIQAGMQLIVSDKAGKTLSNSTAKLKLKKDQYAVLMKDKEIYCNGTNGWVYNIPVKEVTAGACTQSTTATLEPQAIYSTDYGKEFSYKLNGTKSIGGLQYSELELSPVQKSSAIFKVFLYIQVNGIIGGFQVVAKSGIVNTYHFSVVQTTPLPDADFAFDSANHPGVKIILTRLPKPVLVRPKTIVKPA